MCDLHWLLSTPLFLRFHVLQYSLCFPKLVPRETAALVAVALSAARPAAVAVAASLLATKYGQRSNRQQ